MSRRTLDVPILHSIIACVLLPLLVANPDGFSAPHFPVPQVDLLVDLLGQPLGHALFDLAGISLSILWLAAAITAIAQAIQAASKVSRQ